MLFQNSNPIYNNDKSITQVFTAAPSYQGTFGPPTNQYQINLCKSLMTAQYSSIAKFAVLKTLTNKEERPINLHLTLVGQGAYDNAYDTLNESFEKVIEIVKGRNVRVFIHIYDPKRIIIDGKQQLLQNIFNIFNDSNVIDRVYKNPSRSAISSNQVISDNLNEFYCSKENFMSGTIDSSDKPILGMVDVDEAVFDKDDVSSVISVKDKQDYYPDELYITKASTSNLFDQNTNNDLIGIYKKGPTYKDRGTKYKNKNNGNIFFIILKISNKYYIQFFYNKIILYNNNISILFNNKLRLSTIDNSFELYLIISNFPNNIQIDVENADQIIKNKLDGIYEYYSPDRSEIRNKIIISYKKINNPSININIKINGSNYDIILRKEDIIDYAKVENINFSNIFGESLHFIGLNSIYIILKINKLDILSTPTQKSNPKPGTFGSFFATAAASYFGRVGGNNNNNNFTNSKKKYTYKYMVNKRHRKRRSRKQKGGQFGASQWAPALIGSNISQQEAHLQGGILSASPEIMTETLKYQGGNIANVLAQGAAPASLFAANYMYSPGKRGNKRKSNKKTHSRKNKKTHRKFRLY
jgi:hypothetical protein